MEHHQRGAGTVLLGRGQIHVRPRGWLFPVAVLAELAWAAFLWRDYSGFLPWALPAAIAAGIAAVVVLAAARLSRRTRLRIVTIGLTAGVAAMLAAPATWAASVLDTKYGGSSFNASAGPASGFGAGGGQAFSGGAGPRQRFAGFPGAPSGAGEAGNGTAGGMMGATQTLTSAERAIYDYVTAHRNGASYLMAVSSWSQASPYIISTGQEVMPMGGFSGSVPTPTLARVQQLVRTGQLRFFLLGGAGGAGGFGSRGGSSTVSAIESWVQSACTTVPASAYGGTTTTAGSGLGGTQTLYACTPATKASA